MLKVFGKYKIDKTASNYLEIDVLGDEEQNDSNSCWMEFGKHVEEYLRSKNQTTFTYVSVHDPFDFLDEPVNTQLQNYLEIKGKNWKIYKIDLERLAELISSTEFVFAENLFVFLTDVDEKQVNNVIENYPLLNENKDEFNAESLIATNDGCSVLWYNHSFSM